jgi:hypothetical protein
MKHLSKRLFPLVLFLGILLFCSSNASAITISFTFWVKVLCEPGKNAVLYSEFGDLIGTSNTPCNSLRYSNFEAWYVVTIEIELGFITPAPHDEPDIDNPHNSDEIIYLPHNTGIARAHLNPRVTALPSAPDVPDWLRNLGPVNTSILKNNAGKFAGNFESTQFPTLYSARAGNVLMEYKQAPDTGFQVLLSVENSSAAQNSGTATRKLLIPTNDTEASQARLNNHLAEYLSNPTAFLQARLIRECAGDTRKQEESLRTVLPFFTNTSPQP